eukprot:TRINITY_DN54_c0_g1_i16.p2 TRINITY_DN54_c0_g1~~TRINITY_DN54_c0_g1_i16.p2  ORF type:complete len:66 (+),score=17.57 TRINITY_DN54_c0_g1_i16:613-810(+)
MKRRTCGTLDYPRQMSVCSRALSTRFSRSKVRVLVVYKTKAHIDNPHVLCVDTGRSSETAKAHRG